MESAGEQPTHRPIHLKARNDLPITMGIHEMQTKSRASQGAQRQRIRLPTPREADSIPGSGRSPGEDNGNPLQYSCLENPMHRGAWQATVLGGHKRVGHDLATEHAHTMQTKYPIDLTWKDYWNKNKIILRKKGHWGKFLFPLLTIVSNLFLTVRYLVVSHNTRLSKYIERRMNWWEDE